MRVVAARAPGGRRGRTRGGRHHAGMRDLLAIVSNEKGFRHPIIGSPRLHRSGLHAARVLVDRVRSSAFRAADRDPREMGIAPLRPVLAPANALVPANTRGFHCRGLAPAGTVRQGLYAGLRPRAFGLWSRR